MTERMNEIGARTSLAFGIASFGSLAGPPIAGALLRYGSFTPVACFAGGECDPFETVTRMLLTMLIREFLATLVVGVSVGQLSRRGLAKRIGTWRT